MAKIQLLKKQSEKTDVELKLDNEKAYSRWCERTIRWLSFGLFGAFAIIIELLRRFIFKDDFIPLFLLIFEILLTAGAVCCFLLAIIYTVYEKKGVDIDDGESRQRLWFKDD